MIGPTGVALGKQDILYVADTINNRVIAIPNALNRATLAHADKHVLTANGSLNAELGLTVAWNGDILTVNGGDGNIIEITPEGKQIVTKPISTMEHLPARAASSVWRSRPADTQSTSSMTARTSSIASTRSVRLLEEGDECP